MDVDYVIVVFFLCQMACALLGKVKIHGYIGKQLCREYLSIGIRHEGAEEQAQSVLYIP